MNLEGRVAVVTGGGRNLGRSICEALAGNGASVAVNYLSDRVAADGLVETLRHETGRDHLSIEADVSRGDHVERMFERVVDRYGGVDILVNNAGPFGVTPLVELDEAEWDRVVNGNLKSAYLCARVFGPHMRERGWGRIINFSAVSAAVRDRAAYGLAKSAVEVLTEQLALELSPEVTVNAISPGQVEESLGELAEMDNEEWARRVRSATPAKRLVTRREVAEMVVLLCTTAFDLVTGATLPMDGGLRLRRF